MKHEPDTNPPAIEKSARWSERYKLSDAQREAISRAIVQAGLGLLAMYTEATGLESLFLQLSSQAAGQPDDPADSRPGVPAAKSAGASEARP